MIVHLIQNWMTRIGWLLFVFVLYGDKCTKLIQKWMIIAYHIQMWMITNGQNFLELDRKISSEVAWDTCTEIFRKDVEVIHVTPSPKNHNKLHVCSKNSWCQCWMAQGVFSAGILVVTDLVVVSFIYPLSTHLWRALKERKWIWLAWGREIWFTADKRCYYEVPKVQFTPSKTRWLESSTIGW